MKVLHVTKVRSPPTKNCDIGELKMVK